MEEKPCTTNIILKNVFSTKCEKKNVVFKKDLTVDV